MFAERLRAGLAVQAASEYCLGVYFQQRQENPDDFLLQISWTSLADHEAWRASPERARWRKHVSDLIAGETRMLGHYELVDVVKPEVDDVHG
jgi:quinol monooxygenase YgiN